MTIRLAIWTRWLKCASFTISLRAFIHLLQAVRDNQEWEEWVLFLLKGLEETSQETVTLILKMKSLMMEYKKTIREQFPKIYSQVLLNNLFKHPYTKIDLVCDELGVSRPTATSYLNQLVEAGFLTKMKLGRDNFYLNMKLFDLFLCKDA